VLVVCVLLASSSHSHSSVRSRHAATSQSADTEDGTPAVSSGSAASLLAESASVPMFSRRRELDNSSAFVDWLMQHVDLAQTHGFDDNVGRNPVPAIFELATLADWFAVINQLHPLFWADLPSDSRLPSHFTLLQSLSDTDVRFSERLFQCRCLWKQTNYIILVVGNITFCRFVCFQCACCYQHLYKLQISYLCSHEVWWLMFGNFGLFPFFSNIECTEECYLCLLCRVLLSKLWTATVISPTGRSLC